MVNRQPNDIVCCYGDFNLPDIDWENGLIVSHSHRYPLEIKDLYLQNVVFLNW